MIEFGGNNIECKKTAPFSLSIHDTEDNALQIVVALSWKDEKGTGQKTGNDKIDTILKNSSPIYPNTTCTYEILFERYIMYQTRNESYCSWDDYEIRTGRFFIQFTRSRLLEHLYNITDCQILSDGSYYPETWEHYGIYAQNHIIDVISGCKPVITKWNNID